MKKYQIIYADPPWNYPKTGGTKNSRGMAKQFYSTMTIDSMMRCLSVQDFADDNCALFLWCPYPKLEDGLQIIKNWGFTYFGLAFNWIKKTKNNKDFFGMGYYTRANPEPCLLAIKGKLKPKIHNMPQIVYAQIKEHSEKPSIIRNKIVELMGDLPRIELFARQKTEGWDVWGNEVKSDIEL